VRLITDAPTFLKGVNMAYCPRCAARVGRKRRYYDRSTGTRKKHTFTDTQEMLYVKTKTYMKDGEEIVKEVFRCTSPFGCIAFFPEGTA